MTWAECKNCPYAQAIVTPTAYGHDKNFYGCSKANLTGKRLDSIIACPRKRKERGV